MGVQIPPRTPRMTGGFSRKRGAVFVLSVAAMLAVLESRPWGGATIAQVGARNGGSHR